MHLNPLRNGYLGAFALIITALTPVVASAKEDPPYAAYYNPASGFKPAQRDLTKIFMQLAGSLEHHGTPEPYIRHVMSEHERIAKKYKVATGKETTARPQYLTDQYVENLITNWNKMTPGLKLDTLARDAGRNMRLAIMGTWNLTTSELVALEGQLTEQEAIAYRRLLEKSFFTKEDMRQVDAFYSGPYEKIGDLGKAHLSKRVRRGSMPAANRDAEILNEKGGSLVVKLLNRHTDDLMHYLTTDSQQAVNGETLVTSLKAGLQLDGEFTKLKSLSEYERDAIQFSHSIKWEFDQRAAYIRKKVGKAEEAESTVEAMTTMVTNLAIIANSELRAGLVEQRATKASD